MGFLKSIYKEVVRRGRNLLVSVDQLFGCVITLGDAYPDETPSSYSYRLERKGRAFGEIFRPLIDGFFLLVFRQEKHCEKAYLSELSRYDSPKEFRGMHKLPSAPLMNGSTDTEDVL